MRFHPQPNTGGAVMASKRSKPTTTDSSAPVPDHPNSLTAGLCGPPLVQGSRLIKKPAHHQMPFARTISYIGTRAASRTE
jgi:catalase